MWNIVFTVLSHGIGASWSAGLIFNHLPAQNSPWLWSLIHGSAVVAACIGVVVFWRETEDAQQQMLALTTQLAEAEINQRKFTSELLVNLARLLVTSTGSPKIAVSKYFWAFSVDRFTHPWVTFEDPCTPVVAGLAWMNSPLLEIRTAQCWCAPELSVR